MTKFDAQTQAYVGGFVKAFNSNVYTNPVLPNVYHEQPIKDVLKESASAQEIWIDRTICPTCKLQIGYVSIYLNGDWYHAACRPTGGSTEVAATPAVTALKSKFLRLVGSANYYSLIENRHDLYRLAVRPADIVKLTEIKLGERLVPCIQIAHCSSQFYVDSGATFEEIVVAMEDS